MKDNTLEYKGYRGSVEYSASDHCFYGKILGVRSYFIYEGKDVGSLEKDFRDRVNEYLDYCRKEGVKPERDYSGTFQVRISSETHRYLATEAEARGKKLNAIVAEALEKYVAAGDKIEMAEPEPVVLSGESFTKAREQLEKGLFALAGRKDVPARVSDPAFANTLIELMRIVLEQNEVLGLTTIKEPEEFVKLHLLDSLASAGMPELTSAQTIIDVGSGPGFPCLPIAALYPNKQFLMMDSMRKKIEFAKIAASDLGISNVDILHSRAERAGNYPALRESFDLAICRAVGKMSTILEYSLPFVKKGGAAIFYKTVAAKKEIEESLLARKQLGGSAYVRVETYKDILPDRSHALFIVEKRLNTPKAYPRRDGIPSKEPL